MTSSSPPSLRIERLSYRYKKGRAAIDGLNLQLTPGILGLLGPNGAGKSTLMRMLATLTLPSHGQILWRGIDTAKQPDLLRNELGYLPQDFGIYPALTAREFLNFLAAVKALKPSTVDDTVARCLAMVGLSEVADKRLGDFSGGMRQRVGIAQALLNDPQLLILDEPTVGLDPQERLRFRHMLTDLAGQRMVILSTHIVSDVEASASHLAILSGGHLRFHDTPEALMAHAQGKVWDWSIAPEQLDAVRNQHHVSTSIRKDNRVRVRVVSDASPDPSAVPATPDLEDAYSWLLAEKA